MDRSCQGLSVGMVHSGQIRPVQKLIVICSIPMCPSTVCASMTQCNKVLKHPMQTAQFNSSDFDEFNDMQFACGQICGSCADCHADHNCQLHSLPSPHTSQMHCATDSHCAWVVVHHRVNLQLLMLPKWKHQQ